MTMTQTPQGLVPNAPNEGPMQFVAQVIQLVNVGSVDFSMRYGPRDRLVLQPGGRAFVQEEVAWHFLGRWWATDADPRNRLRTQEWNRLRVLYGAYEDTLEWENRKPQLEAYTADGRKITTIVDDPEGLEGVNPQTQFGNEQSLEAQMAVMQQQMLVLQAQLQASRGPVQEVPDDTALPSSAPNYPPIPTTPMQTVPGIPQPVPVAPAPVNVGPIGVELPVHAVPVDLGGDTPGLPPGAGDVIPAGEADEVPTDTPQRIPTGPTGPTGGRIPAGG